MDNANTIEIEGMLLGCLLAVSAAEADLNAVSFDADPVEYLARFAALGVAIRAARDAEAAARAAGVLS